MIPLLIGACPSPRVEVAPTTLAGQVTLSADHDRDVARLRVVLHEPITAPLPSERQGLAIDSCDTLLPNTAVVGGPATGAEVRAWCGGEELALKQREEILWVHVFPEMPPSGLACRLEIDLGDGPIGVALPPLPAPPDLERRGRQMEWTPMGADEIRVSVPQSQGQTTLCRLADDGKAPAPRGLRLQTGFVTRVEIDVVRLGDARLELTSIGGRWLRED